MGEQVFCDNCWAAPPKRCESCERAYQAGRAGVLSRLRELRDGFFEREARHAIDYALERIEGSDG